MRLAGRKRAIVLIDGEHHPAAVSDALGELSVDQDIVAVVFCGGSEKVAAPALADPDQHYGYPVIQAEDAMAGLQDAIERSVAEVVVDFADEPIVPLDQKLRLASLALAAGLEYDAPGMYLTPQRKFDSGFSGPKLSVIGTGKRTGKTAVCGHLATLLKARGESPVIVSMGRGGPAVPQTADPNVGLEDLIAMVRRGGHAASDYLEDAVLAGVPSVGCRRVGGGPAGDAAFTNFEAGVGMAKCVPGVTALLFEGSGSTVPPVRSDRTICIVGNAAQADQLAGPLRLVQSQLTLVPAGDAEALEAANRWSSGIVAEFTLIPTLVKEVPDTARLAFFSTGDHPLDGHEPVVRSANLARRDALEQDLAEAKREGCTHYATELKAAAIDVVAMAAKREGVELIFVRNRPSGVGAQLDEILLTVFDQAAGAESTDDRAERHFS
jgi:cyclic 2,3-diphosphoglycerate synthetase